VKNTDTKMDDPRKISTSVSHRILRLANKSYSLREFSRKVTKALTEFSGADCIEIRLIEAKEIGYHSYCINDMSNLDMKGVSRFGSHDSNSPELSDFEWLCTNISNGIFDPALPFFTPFGSFFTGDSSRTFVFSRKAAGQSEGRTVHIEIPFTSLVIIPFQNGDTNRGLLIAANSNEGFFSEETVGMLEEIAQTLGIAFLHHNTQVALRERVKELSCLYEIARVASKSDTPIEKVLKKTVALLPPGWLYPDITCSRITLDGDSYSVNDFKETYPKLSARVVVGGVNRGVVEVAYKEERPELDEGPFLREERNLINAVAREISLIIEKRRIEEEREELNEQLRHAHRLATIGQLAAGIAHEINEPLANILGFAQLAEKQTDVPSIVRKDLQKIIKASLHGREVIKKLMLFARQAPPGKQKLNLNNVIREGLFLFESRCMNTGVELKTVLDEKLPEIFADRSQIYQVLVNLVVNSIQAMPDGGILVIRTGVVDDHVTLIVEDTGIGIDDAVIDKLFVPFFSTKDVNEGTGLGLSVVHGIVASHGGTVTVESELGKGALFTVNLPIAGNSPDENPELSLNA